MTVERLTLASLGSLGVLRLSVSRFALDLQTVSEWVISELDFSALSGSFLFILELASWRESGLSDNSGEDKIEKLHNDFDCDTGELELKFLLWVEFVSDKI